MFREARSKRKGVRSMVVTSELAVVSRDLVDAVPHPGDDLIAEFGSRMGRVWACERFIRLASGNPEVAEFWESIQLKEQERIEQIKSLLK